MPGERNRVVFLLDVDNTLLDNDRVTADLKRYLVARGRRRARRALLGDLRGSSASELGYADYLGALQRYRVERPRDPACARPVIVPRQLSVREPAVSQSLDVVEHLGQWGPTVISVRR